MKTKFLLFACVFSLIMFFGAFAQTQLPQPPVDDWGYKDWGLFTIGLYELLARYIPTRYNLSIIDNIVKVVAFLVRIIPNKKAKDEYFEIKENIVKN